MMKQVVLVVVIAFGCNKPKRNAMPEEAWGVADYASEGLRIDAPWTADEYPKATATLARIATDHRDRLPRFHGAKSGAVFARLVTDLPDDTSRPVGERFIAHATHAAAIDKLMKLYMPNQWDTPPREWIELLGTELRESCALATLSEPFLATFGPDDPSRAARLDGLAKMKAGYGLMLLGGVYCAAERRISDDDRIAMLGYVTAALPTLYPLVSADSQTQLRELIDKQAAGFPEGRLRDAAIAAQHALPR